MWVYKSKVIHVAFGLLVAFIPLFFIFSAYDLYIVTGTVLFTTSVGALHAYFPAMREAVDRSINELSRIDILTTAIMLILLGTAMREVYVTFWLWYAPLPVSRPDSFYSLLALLRYVAVCATLMFLCSRKPVQTGRLTDHIPGWPRGVISVAIGLILALAMLMWK